MNEMPEIAGTVPVGVVTKVKGTGQRISRASDIASYAATCDDASWLARALHAERGAGARPGALKALLGRLETLGLDPEEVEG